MSRLVQAWYQGSPWLRLLRPLSVLFQWVASRRRSAYQSGRKSVCQIPVPVLVVGNISVGGVGKTPLVAKLADHFIKSGLRPGIVSRGYGSRAPQYPYSVTVDADVDEAGDEPYMLSLLTGCPVVIDPDRVAAAQHLLANFQCDVILSDDGLQHYGLGRDLEVAVIDAQRGLGNGRCLPEGPLREPVERLDEVDWIVVNGGKLSSLLKPVTIMTLEPGQLVNLVSAESCSVNRFAGSEKVHAVAGIGNPQRFFDTLASLGYSIIEHVFPDHHRYLEAEISFDDDKAVIMTQKDAVKCRGVASDRCWYLTVEARLDGDFLEQVITRIKQITADKSASAI